MPIILGFVGELSSGKGTLCQYLKEKYQAPSYRFSTILRDLVKRLHLEMTRENLQGISQVIREKFGQDTLAKVIAADVASDQSPVITVDGVRRLADIKYLRALPGFFLIYVTAEQKTRWERIVKRGENSDDTKKTFIEFQKDDSAEAEQQIKEAAQTANFTINNNLGINELYAQVEEIISKIKSTQP